MKDETKFLIEIADKFGKDAQSILDFVAKSGNLEKAAKALSKPDANDSRPTSAITGSNEELPMEEQSVSNALAAVEATSAEEVVKWTAFPPPNGTILFSPTEIKSIMQQLGIEDRR